MLLAIPAIAGAGLAAGDRSGKPARITTRTGPAHVRGGRTGLFYRAADFPTVDAAGHAGLLCRVLHLRILFGLLIIILLAFGVLGE